MYGGAVAILDMAKNGVKAAAVISSYAKPLLEGCGTIKKGEEAIGNETKVKVVKNKVSPPFKTAEFDILFGEGISRHGEIIDMGVNARIIEKSGAWYAYNGEKIGQGRDNAREFLRENEALAHEIENKVRESLGIPLLPDAGTPA